SGSAGTRMGVYGFAGGGATNYGVFGEVNGGSGYYGVYGKNLNFTTGYAGYFNGRGFFSHDLRADANLTVDDTTFTRRIWSPSASLVMKSIYNVQLTIDQPNDPSLNGYFEVYNGAGAEVFYVSESGNSRSYGNHYVDLKLGIGTVTPQYPLVFGPALGDKISLYGGYGAANADHYGFGIQSSLMQLFTPTSTSDIAFGYGRSAAFTERMRITGDGFVGIGISNPLRPLSFPAVLGKKISLYPGATGDAGFGVYGNELRIHSDNPSADITFGYDVLPSSYVERMRVKGNGNVGIGTNAPTFLLDVNGRMRLRHNGSSSGIWFSNSLNNDDPGFIGMYNDTHTGFYGDNGAGWGFVMNTTSGNVGIGSLNPSNKLTVNGNTNTIGLFNNVSSNSGTIGIYASALSGINGSGVLGFGQTGVEGYGIYTGGLVNIGVYGEANSGTTNYAGYFSGNVYTTGVYQSSDRKLKDNITQITNATDIIRNLNPTMYTYKTKQYPHMYLPEGLQYGLIADEVLKIIPGAVTKAIQPAQYENHDEQNGRKLNDEVQFNAVNYTQMIPILIGAMKEQQLQMEKQQMQIERLEAMIEELRKD
ncbi:MAG TPA: tail fiber domain-containing protein, partial [Saprospiraceae bacterium]|nr:tail fiber domain-containing protein [Saprospiraceae bacterium]